MMIIVVKTADRNNGGLRYGCRVMIYSAQVLNHFHHPRCAGAMERATAQAEAANPVCGDALKLWAEARDGRIVRAAFKAAGCVPAMACGSWLAEWLTGRSLTEASALSAETMENALGGLPVASRHASALALEALRRLLDSIPSRG